LLNSQQSDKELTLGTNRSSHAQRVTTARSGRPPIAKQINPYYTNQDTISELLFKAKNIEENGTDDL